MKQEFFEVTHPLRDAPEEKCNPDLLGPMKMSRGVKLSLLLLRVYLVSISILLLFHVLGLAGAL
ncbi:MAG: hypothetical protein KGM47_04330 [Acidobacteriota bacterium]|nr:hypothetical protein [Acidobacteriota bacterium]